MKNRNGLLQLISERKWDEIVKKFTIDEICQFLSFKEITALAYDLFFENFRDDDEIPDYAVRLFFSIKNHYSSEWNSDWKNDAFLGKLCSITWRYDEMYQCFKEAYDKLSDPPDSLLLLLAKCNSVPEEPPITAKESEEYLIRALAKKLTYEAALRMRALSREKNEKEQEEYWDRMCDDLEKRNVHTETIIPDVLSSQNRR